MTATVTITRDDVQRSIERAKTSLDRSAEEVMWQIDNQVWTVLGYESWDAMREAIYDGPAFMVPSPSRPNFVHRLRDTGMSQRAIADTLGVSRMTINRDLSQSVTVTNVTEACPPRSGVTKWSRRVQAISHDVPMDDLTNEEVEELWGAADFLRNYCQGTLKLRGVQAWPQQSDASASEIG
jgi:predicted transcriptional regulator